MSFLTAFTTTYIAATLLNTFNLIAGRRELDRIDAVILFLVFSIAWFGTALILHRTSDTTVQIYTLSFLVLAALWLVQLGTSILTSLLGLALIARNSESPIDESLTTLMAGPVILINVGFAVTMALASLIGYAVAVLLPRELAHYARDNNANG